MTMIVGCHFSEGAVLLADSRATWLLGNGKNTYQDTLQKIFPFPFNMSMGFAGHIATATHIMRAIHNRVVSSNRLKHVASLGPNIGRFAKHEYQTLTGSGQTTGANSLVLVGIQPTRGKPTPIDVHLWTYESPRYYPLRVEHDFMAMGSGADIVAPFLRANWADLLSQQGGLKGKADWLISRLEHELELSGDLYVGGLFQVLMIDSEGIRPLTYGKFSLDPDDGDEPIKMTIEKGVWTQSNLRTGTAISLHGPSGLKAPPSSPIAFKSYSGQPRITKHYPESFLTYFVPCAGIQQLPGRASFIGVGNCFALEDFPARFRLLACLATHPEPGHHDLLVKFGAHQDNMRTVYQETIESIYPLQEIRRHPEVELEIPSEDNYFLELWLDTYRLARKPLVIRQVIPELRSIDKESQPSPELVQQQKAHLIEEQTRQSDPELSSGDAILSYLVPCGRCEIRESEILFDGIGQTVFPPKFPAQMRYQIPIGFRVKPGSYRLRVDLTESATRTVMPVTTASIESLHEFREVQVQGEIMLSFPKQGVYVLDFYLNERRIGRTHFFVDDVNSPMAYNLRQQDVDRVRAGETIMLVRDTVGVNEVSAEQIEALEKAMARRE